MSANAEASSFMAVYKYAFLATLRLGHRFLLISTAYRVRFWLLLLCATSFSDDNINRYLYFKPRVHRISAFKNKVLANFAVGCEPPQVTLFLIWCK